MSIRKRLFNFNAGPATLPLPVLEEASRGVLEIGNSGMSILEVSHRAEPYESIHAETKVKLLRILGVDPTKFTVLFLGGGASLQFLTLPTNYLSKGETADYVHTGEWSAKAMKEAKPFGTVHLAASSEADKFASIPKDIKVSANSRYLHLTTNNTIEGTQFSTIPNAGPVPLVADFSSEFLSRSLDYSKFSLMYSGAQKNLGPAGVTVVVIRNDFLAQAKEDLPAMLSYKQQAKADSLYNTPPVFSIYVVGLVLKWIESEGGIAKVAARNRRKAEVIYSALEEFPDIYDIVVKNKEDRSDMNLTFRVKPEAREKDFLNGATAKGMEGLKGHRSVGGLRASIYNAFPEEGAVALAQYLREFARK